MSNPTIIVSKTVNHHAGYEVPDVKILRFAHVSLRAWDAPKRALPLWHIYWNKTPGAKIVCKTGTLNLDPSVMVLLPGYTLFEGLLARPVEHFFVDFMLNGEPFNRLVHEPIMFHVADYLPIIGSAAEPSELDGVRAAALVFRLLIDIPDHCYAKAESQVLDPRIAHALEMLAFGTGTSGLCRKVHMSESNFQQLFKRQLGVSPKQYSLNLRLDNARRMLLDNNMSIPQIAEASGFADRYHFSKAFKQMFKISPAAWRERRKELGW